jgi:hypothetical protein
MVKKIDREYVLTDSTVNCYGFRLLTSGYLIDEYKKNPIGYHMHAREAGVVVKWEDLRVDGDTVYGKPVINMSNGRAEQTVSEIENGFLNAASVGHLVVLEYTDDPEQKLPGQSGPTVTKWFNRECSLVDIGGNFNALALYDQFDNPINLSDFSQTKLPTMKKIEFTGAQLAAMNLKADADETTVATAFNDLVAKAAKADGFKTELENLKSKVTKDTVKGLLDSALAASKITQELHTTLSADYASNPEGLKTLLSAMPPYQSITDEIKTKGKGNEKRIADLMAKSWDALMESGETVELKAISPDSFKQKFKEEFGTEPK